jgi:hypothetical protein
MNRRRNEDEAKLALLDRLVCDELTFAERSDLLRWLEADSMRWRACALAFLEAQTWKKALRADALAPTAAVPVVAAKIPSKRTRGAWLAVAAAALAAFLGGWGGATLMKGAGPGLRELAVAPIGNQETAAAAGAARKEDETVFASFPIAGAESNERRAELKVPVTQGESATPSPVADAVISEYERRRWERLGYRVSKIREYVPGKLPDGQPVLLSVDRLRVERIAVPTL